MLSHLQHNSKKIIELEHWSNLEAIAGRSAPRWTDIERSYLISLPPFSLFFPKSTSTVAPGA